MFFVVADAARVKRQEEATTKKEESFEAELCKDKDAGEWFRLVAGDNDACRDVIQCTSSVSFIYKLQIKLIICTFFVRNMFCSYTLFHHRLTIFK